MRSDFERGRSQGRILRPHRCDKLMEGAAKHPTRTWTEPMFLHVSGLKVYYEVAGAGHPVLLLHGWGTHSGSMRPILEFMRESADVRVFALDFPGFGLSESPPKPWNVNDYVALVRAVLDGLRLEKVDIIAHSFGGRVAIKLAAEHPQVVERLVLVDSAGIRPKRTVGYYLKVGVAKTTRILIKVLPGFLSNPVRTRVLAKIGSTDYRNAGQMRQTFVRIVNEDLRQLLPAIKCPTLIVWGELDTETPLDDARFMEQMIPNARLVVLEGAGHFCYLDRFSAFSEVVSSFVGGRQ